MWPIGPKPSSGREKQDWDKRRPDNCSQSSTSSKFKVAIRQYSNCHTDVYRHAHTYTHGHANRIRHPRYVETVLWILGYALFTNYPAVYLIFLFLLPVIHVIVLFEEKELKERFGRAYEEYCRRVPRYLPKNLFGGAQGRVTRFL